MTNKLPVVGKRYKEKYTGKIVKCVIASFNSPLILKFETDDGEEVSFNLTMWERLFEELPEDKAETKPETQSHISELSPEVKETVKQFIYSISLWDRFFPENNNLFEKPPLDSGITAMMNAKDVLDLAYKASKDAKNLLNALDKQFMSKEGDKIDTKQDNVDSIDKKESILAAAGDIGNLGLTPEQIYLFEIIFNSYEKLKERVTKLEKNNA